MDSFKDQERDTKTAKYRIMSRITDADQKKMLFSGHIP